MRNKGFFWGITITLVLACIYQLSFTWATSGVENDADAYGLESLDSLRKANVPYVVAERDTLYMGVERDEDRIAKFYAGQFLKSKQNEEIHWGYTYGECKEKEINLGLDLKGGMSVTLEISVPDLVSELAGNTRNQTFRKAFDQANVRTNAGEGDFVDMFGEEYAKVSDVPMAKVFHMHNTEDVAADATNEEVIDFLKRSAASALDGVEIIIEKRVNTFGVAQPTIQKQPASNRIFVELPGVKDKETVRRRLQSTANLEFFEVYDNVADGIGTKLFDPELEKSLSNVLYGDELLEEVVETAEPADTSATEPADSTESSLLEEVAEEGDDLLAPAEEGDDLLSSADEGESADGQDDLLGDAESTDTTGEGMSRAEQLKKFPISSVLAPYVGMAGENQYYYVEGPIVGVASVRDTSSVNARLNHPLVRAAMPLDLEFMWAAKQTLDENKQESGRIALYAIKVPSTGAQVDGEDIKKSSVRSPEIGQFVVNMQFTNLGSQKWEKMTEANIKKPVAITMDKIVFSAPVVQQKMSNSSDIEGRFDLNEATELSGLLNAGALPAPVKIVDESVVGPSIGASNVSAGMWSFLFALGVVLLYMVFYYSKAGIIADFALVINIFLLIGALASLSAILTLPGIAGIVLTIGMSVDANVLIFERIREELRGGKGVKAAVKDGFAKALAAILDANITTLLTGIVLSVFGTGPIKGFATTLIIGIFTSFFAAVVITRLIVTTFLDKEKSVSFSSKITENWFTNTAVPFVRKRRLFYIVSGLIIAIGLGSMFTRGLDWGVDFEGGRQYKVQFKDQPADNSKIISDLTKVFEGQAPSAKMVDDKYTSLITTKYNITDPSTEMNNQVEGMLMEGLSGHGELEVLESKMIAPTISKDLKQNSIYAVSFSLIVIFLYIVFRFRKWQYGLGALIAMAHDVLVVLAIFSLCWGWIGFSMEIDQAFIAAILTVVGYSINDTVVVFDRIREYLGIHHKKERKEVINMALNSTLSRTINTSVSTFIVLLVIFIFGGEAIKGFTFALMVGVVVGTYSSLFIATPAVIDFSKEEAKEKN